MVKSMTSSTERFFAASNEWNREWVSITLKGEAVTVAEARVQHGDRTRDLSSCGLALCLLYCALLLNTELIYRSLLCDVRSGLARTIDHVW